MRLTRRDLLQLGLGTVGLGGFGLPARAEWSGGGHRSVGHSLLGATKYGDEFTHFDYVNPDAPKGGLARVSRTGQFDSFNPFIAEGAATDAATMVIESLMTPSLDQGSTHYGLLAEWIEQPDDQSWVAFRLRPEARWHDGEPVTVADVRASFELLVTKGAPLYRFYYGDVDTVVDEGDGVVRFRFKGGGNKELPHILGQLNVFPAHWWASRVFDKATLEPLLGSGPYRFGAFEAGRHVELERVADYWGAALPVNVGSNNFDRIRFEYFLDRDPEFEAFKRGVVDYWDENSAKRWAERFDFPAFRSGKVIKREIPLAGPKTAQGFVFNIRREKFADRRVREAFSLAFDFAWTNRSVFYDQYARPASYFQGSEGLMAAGLPDAAELALLEPYRAELPPALFERPFEQPVTDGSGRIRRNQREALRLLGEAGFEVRDQRLHDANGEPVRIEFLAASASQEPVIAPFLKNLEQMGVEATLRMIDAAQYVRRTRSYDFDMVVSGWANSESPGNEQREYWGSAAGETEGGRNLAGVRNPAVDALIEKIIFAEDRAALEVATRALDRVLLWEHYAVLELYAPLDRIAYWDRFGAPDPLPPRDAGFMRLWWHDAEKASKL